MRKLSDGFVNSAERYFARIERSGGAALESDEIQSLCITQNLIGTSDALTLGSTPAAQLEAKITAGVDLLNETVTVFIGREVEGAAEEVCLGRFDITSSQENGAFTDLLGYDAFYSVFERAYSPGTANTAEAVLAEIAEETGLSLSVPDDASDAAVTLSAGYTLRETVGYMAALLGCNARLDGDCLRLSWFDECELCFDAERIYADALSMETQDWTLGRLQCTVTEVRTETDEDGNTTQTSEDVTLQSGDGATGIGFSDPFMTQEILDTVFARIGGLCYRGGSFSAPGDLRAEPGDIVTVSGKTFPIMTALWDYDGGLRMTLSAYAKSETASGSASGPITQAMARMTAQFGIFENLQAESFTAVNAKIRALQAERIDVTDLRAEVAEIQNLLAGNAGIGDLQAIRLSAENVVIDDALITDAMIADLSAGKLTAGTIYTELVKIADGEGRSLWIDGATLQFSDADGNVREQLGLDESGRFNNYIWDESGGLIWNALGLTETGLLGNGAIIRDAAVAGDAAISGSKLDITSVASRLSEDGTLIVNGAQVEIGETTLDYELRTITEEIEGLEGVSAEGLSAVTPIYALGDSETVPPPDSEAILPALTDEAETDFSFTDVYAADDLWSEEQPAQCEGRFLWLKYRCTYLDGHVEETPAVLLTDAYLRNSSAAFRTELSVVQGDISAVVSATEILSETIRDQYAELNVGLDGVTALVSATQSALSETESALKSAEAKLELKVDTDNLISAINAGADVITLRGNRIVISSDFFSLSADGTVYASGGSFAGDVAADSFSLVGTEMTVENRTISYNFYALVGSVISPSVTRFTGDMFAISAQNGMAVDGTLYAEHAVLEEGHLEDGSFETLTGNKLNAISLTVTGNFNTASAAAVNSDRVLKSNISPLDSRFDLFFDRLLPRSYELKDAPGEKHLGLVADEAETALRDAGLDPADWALTDRLTDADGEERGAIRYEELIALLVREVQELKEEVRKLKETPPPQAVPLPLQGRLTEEGEKE